MEREKISSAHSPGRSAAATRRPMPDSTSASMSKTGPVGRFIGAASWGGRCGAAKRKRRSAVPTSVDWAGPSRRMTSHPTVILGGGLSGAATAYALAEAGCTNITVIERGPTLGGLAGSFEREAHFYPLGYHHILDRDRTLLYFLDRIGALPSVRWRRVRMLFHLGGRAYNLGSPAGFLAFPMSLRDKAGFVRLMLKA